MLKISPTSVSLALLILFGSAIAPVSSLARADEDDALPEDAPQVAAEEVRAVDTSHWLALGHRWALSLDSKGKSLALYDLSYPDSFTHLHLGTINQARISAGDVAALLKEEGEGAEGDQAKLLGNALAALKKTRADEPMDRMPQGWWKSVPWDSRGRAEADEAPSSFTLADVGFEKSISDQDEYRKLREKGESALETTEHVKMTVSRFLRQFRYERQPDGSYELYYEASDAELLPTTGPHKIVDFRSVRSGVYRKIAWKAFQKALSYGIGHIPAVPIVSALVGTAMERYFHYRDQMDHSHLDLALEMLDAAERGEALTAFSGLSAEDRAKAGVAITLTETGVYSNWKWLLKKPEKEWRKSLPAEVRQAEVSNAWLSSHGHAATALNPRFSSVRDGDSDQAIYLSARSCSKKKGPVMAVDFARPAREHERRKKIELISIAVGFGTRLIPTPGVSTVINQAYGFFVANPLMKTKYWEARLDSLLEERERVAGENRQAALHILDEQRINPWELSRERSEALIAKRRAALGL